ncbi:glycosyltransferase [Microbulbifer variabilis]|uniref:glycosyltransferase n=1 Tax=Microbulbifer variabilis TaxID=266805 RepID=UPI001CFD772A|nr:glycosyltransferase [Microbulbifer variabilis]
MKRFWGNFNGKRSKAIASECDSAPIAADQFDPQWYLQTYPDVAAAGVDPWVHYINHGRFEGRQPYRNRSLAWEYHLWRGGDKLLLPQLEQLAVTPGATSQERYYAAWAIARWYAANDDWSKVLSSLQQYQGAAYPYPAHVGPYLLLLEAALQLGQWGIAQKTLSTLSQRFPGQAEVALAEANLLASKGNNGAVYRQLSRRRLNAINQVFLRHGLCELAGGENGTLGLDSIYPAMRLPILEGSGGPRVSVIIPTYNAARTLTTALCSLCEQTWRDLEILVVDDASDDGTWQVLEDFVRNTRLRSGLEIRLLLHERNQGAYAARNTALKEASGDLITTHDSDDWSHPQKIECQVRALISRPDKVGCTSHWVRTTDDLHFSHRLPEESWVYRNVSSLMIRRSVVEILGCWDRVSVNADTEYYYRILKAFGENALVEALPGVPLSFGRISEGSLSRRGETHLFTRYCGVRKDYEDAARRWHARAESVKDLYLPANPDFRPFQAPSAICYEDKPVLNPNPMDIVQQSGYFDPTWYLERYSDLQDSQVDLFEHYWSVGSAEGRDPGPEFSTTGYGYRFPEAKDDSLPALHHYLTVGHSQGVKPLEELSGAQSQRPGALNLLICGHQAGEYLYGAERSLLDVLAVLNKLDVNLIVTLPSAMNTAYVEAIRFRAMAVIVLPYGWWKAARIPCPQTLAQFEVLIQKFDIQAVYANTLVLDEPLLAARALKVITLIHVRELPFQDEALCRTLGAEAASIVARVQALADIVVANSKTVEREIAARKSVIVPNIVDINQFKKPRKLDAVENRLVRIALISSNSPKKGVADFVKLAEKLEQRSIPVSCVLIGPENDYTRDLRSRQQSGEIAQCLQFAGYAAGPQEALVQADIVVNLSHFHESFGRTVLEAMAAALPVVAYHWGALPELIEDGSTGFLVPFGSVDAVLDRVTELVLNKNLRQRLGYAGRKRATQFFNEATMLDQLAIALQWMQSMGTRSTEVF